ncbi:hypothetical protein AB0I72_19450 [Nocardiopsis sp. NPDC049922]|uniref:hypothetical protein n=1 Tax=Nocardiopsis sp. NPDC049922 TaxID=3155157 RepID=UPI0033D3EF6E
MALEFQIHNAAAARRPALDVDTINRGRHALHISHAERDRQIEEAERSLAGIMVRRLTNRHHCASACGCPTLCPPGAHGTCDHPDHDDDMNLARTSLEALGLEWALETPVLPEQPVGREPTPPPTIERPEPLIPASLRRDTVPAQDAPVEHPPAAPEPKPEPRRAPPQTAARPATPKTPKRTTKAPRAKATPPAPTRRRVPIACGTRQGYQRHLRRKEDPCEPCRHANRQKPQKATPDAPARPRKPIKHGTPAGYSQHRYRGEQPCADCTRAASAAQRARREKKRST